MNIRMGLPDVLTEAHVEFTGDAATAAAPNPKLRLRLLCALLGVYLKHRLGKTGMPSGIFPVN